MLVNKMLSKKTKTLLYLFVTILLLGNLEAEVTHHKDSLNITAGSLNSNSNSNSTSTDSSPEDPSSLVIPNCFHETQLRDELFFRCKLNKDENNEFYVTAELIYDGFGWLGIGITEKNRAVMAGSQAIIGRLDDEIYEADPILYSMTRSALSGVTPMPQEYQTLFDHKIEETETSTILSFSKYVKEPFHHTLNISEPIVFLYALGFTHQFRPHPFYGSFKVDFNETCVSTLSEIKGKAHTSVTFENLQDHWRLHGIFASLAWAIAVPAAFLSSVFRHLFPSGKTWIRTHLWLNVMASLFTIGATAIALLVFRKSGKTNFSKPHHIIGLFILVLCMTQMMNGILRPPSIASKRHYRWQRFHKTLGLITYILSIYQIASGLQLYSEMYSVWNWNIIYGIWTAIILSVVAYFKIMRGDQEKAESDV